MSRAQVEELHAEHRALLAELLREHRAALAEQADANLRRMDELLQEHRAQLAQHTDAALERQQAFAAQVLEKLQAEPAETSLSLESVQHSLTTTQQLLHEQVELQAHGHQNTLKELETLADSVAQVGQSIGHLALHFAKMLANQETTEDRHREPRDDEDRDHLHAVLEDDDEDVIADDIHDNDLADLNSPRSRLRPITPIAHEDEDNELRRRTATSPRRT